MPPIAAITCGRLLRGTGGDQAVLAVHRARTRRRQREELRPDDFVRERIGAAYELAEARHPLGDRLQRRAVDLP